MINDMPATSLRFERQEKGDDDSFTLSFHLAGLQVARFKGIKPAELEGIVGEENAEKILTRSDLGLAGGNLRGTLSGESLANAYGLSPAEREARETAKSQGDRAASFVQEMQSRHPAVQDAAAGQWTVQIRQSDGLYRDLVTTDDAHEAHRLFQQGPQFRVLDNKIGDFAADYSPDEKRRGERVAEYHVRSGFRELIEEREPNQVRPDRVRTRDMVDVDEALQAAQRLRERDRDAIETERLRVGNLAQDAKRRDNENDLDELAGRKPSFAPLTMTEHEKNRRIELSEQLHAQFRVHGSEYRFKDQPGKIAFRDAGDTLKTASNDDRVARAMATMAEAKGWKTISVSGHPDFRREVWLEASLRGLEVRGYKPQDQDLKDLQALRERQERNGIERVPERSKPGLDANAEKSPAKAPERAQETGRGHERAAATESATEHALKAFTGLLVAHGAAPYRNDPKENQSYFVTLATAKGDETVWGKDLARSIRESAAQRGDAITISYRGNEPVTVDAVKRDAQGKAIGREPVNTHRNSWEVAKAPDSDRAKIVKSVAAAVVAEKVKDPEARQIALDALNARIDREDKAGRLPPVQVYDHSAPSKDHGADKTRPQVERRAERTR
ncbi:LPD7 domain-containing protein [Mesorhizobium sp. J428]|uniref:LPD7 domain-containing protein n=1 Tax=Mesorhizobium sp. J428 TaxID=2898440 RepID=UPI0021506E5F|nr:LPD7 domain-containing protein [Mesorhizobium sp. J428]MCR5860137.1 hypothetical protein [Mesorhizobium sp. J428]